MCLRERKELVKKHLKDVIIFLSETKKEIEEINKDKKFVVVPADLLTHDFQTICESFQMSLEAIERNNLKCVFLGKTSNGKSTVINALLGEDVLPSSLGSTTSCFVSVEGCDDEEGYLLDSNNKRQDIESIQTFANDFDKKHYSVNTKFRIFWPKSKSSFLKNDLEIVDCPGLDKEEINDHYIKEYCKDTDVYVIVLDAQSPINKSEREMFQKMNKNIPMSNVIFLINQWDKTEPKGKHKNNPEIIKKNAKETEKLKEQHTNAVTAFLEKDINLKVSNDKKIIYLVSAKGALNSKKKYELDDFQEFLVKEMLENSLQTKIRPRILKIQEALPGLIELFENAIKISRKNQSIMDELTYSIKRDISKGFDEMFTKIKELVKINIDRCLWQLQNDSPNKSVNIDAIESGTFSKLSIISRETIRQLNDLKEVFIEKWPFKKIELNFLNGKIVEESFKKYQEEIQSGFKDVTDLIRHLIKNKQLSEHIRTEDPDRISKIEILGTLSSIVYNVGTQLLLKSVNEMCYKILNKIDMYCLPPGATLKRKLKSFLISEIEESVSPFTEYEMKMENMFNKRMNGFQTLLEQSWKVEQDLKL